MANQEHLDILKQGVEVWNRWRKEYPEVQPDLTSIDLDGANLCRINLHRAYLKAASLVCANLENADLPDVNFVAANLSSARLRGCDLTHANFHNANLSDADLSGAALYRTDLSRATLIGTNFARAYVERVIFGDVDLQSARGLETVDHHGPSTIGIDTLSRSQGNIAETFLRGAGVPDAFITYARSLVNNPLEYYTCFISYSNRDQNFAERLYADLQAQGVRCWYAPEDLKIGDHYHQRIDESIHLYDKLILILSEKALQSAWVEREVVAAREKEDRTGRLVLFPVRLDETVMTTTKAWAADIRRRWHIGDFTRWKDHDEYQKAFQRLLRDLKAETK